jgi:hypothetical protein
LTPLFEAPDLYFWVSKGTRLTGAGVKLSSPEFGASSLGVYTNAKVRVCLPGQARLADYGSFGLWCKAFGKDFGSVRLAQAQEASGAQDSGSGKLSKSGSEQGGGEK